MMLHKKTFCKDRSQQQKSHVVHTCSRDKIATYAHRRKCSTSHKSHGNVAATHLPMCSDTFKIRTMQIWQKFSPHGILHKFQLVKFHATCKFPQNKCCINTHREMCCCNRSLRYVPSTIGTFISGCNIL